MTSWQTCSCFCCYFCCVFQFIRSQRPLPELNELSGDWSWPDTEIKHRLHERPRQRLSHQCWDAVFCLTSWQPGSPTIKMSCLKLKLKVWSCAYRVRKVTCGHRETCFSPFPFSFKMFLISFFYVVNFELFNSMF